MKTYQRPIVAAIAISALNGSAPQMVYDHGAGRWTRVSVRCEQGQISAYDEARAAHVGGSLDRLFDSGERQHLSISVSEGRVHGFDYGTRQHFDVQVNGEAAALYDYETNAFYQFSFR